ncbi:hypothetical protein SCHPADRAFT_933071 [Schizopora paradoxa]|uniref:Ribosomal protein S6 n=1 Tax=Schizopora paradoxa TaxID=27342 RepID=A0A0H2R3T4_9AGAM|nr:hypothetical protein SCHPADRAFT_933071 [Schizopora paradoxa]
MPLYRLLCISAHYHEYKHIKDLVTQSATLLLENGGVVRDIENMGMRTLPQRMHRHKAWHYHGDYWSISFDASPQLAAQLSTRLRHDPRVVRHTTRKLGTSLPAIAPSSPRTPGGSLPGQTVRLSGRRAHFGIVGDLTGGSNSFDDVDVDVDAALNIPMAPQQRSAFQEARRKAAEAEGIAGGAATTGRRSFSTVSTTIPTSSSHPTRSQAIMETRWLEGRHHS